MKNNIELYSIAEACKLLKMGRSKLTREIEKGAFKLTHNEKGVKRLYANEINEYLKKSHTNN